MLPQVAGGELIQQVWEGFNRDGRQEQALHGIAKVRE